MNPTLSIPTPHGPFIAEYSPQGLRRLRFPGGRALPPARHRAATPPPSPEMRRWHTATVKALKAALAGRPPSSLPPLDDSSGTDFQRRVWAALREIPPGQTRSYAELAATIGRPGAARAVGGACGANPIPVFNPCHRVLAAGRRLGGFSGGLDWKRTLLAREGIQFAAR